MKKKVGIRFKPAGKIYDFDSGAFVLGPGDQVIVETEKGLGFGTVVIPPAASDSQKAKPPLKKVVRLASPKDFERIEKNRETEKRAYRFCKERVQELGLKMNLFSVESNFDASRLVFFFTAEKRVDFRKLVKILVKRLGVRVEMRQVGIRNQAKMCGGIGRCGREICCSKFIEKFETVSIRMAKSQSLSLNPTKISGLCGRLMCCLNYEFETYRDLQKKFPKIGKKILTPDGRGKVVRHNVLGKKLAVRLEDGLETEYQLDDILKMKTPHR
jgi:cell fate regulator YaaT (PSP1 superfamily)